MLQKSILPDSHSTGVFEIDYSPQSVTISHAGITRRQFLNISQEAKSCIDELRENKLLNGLKIATEDFQPITAYQVSTSGIKVCNNHFLEVLLDIVAVSQNAPQHSLPRHRQLYLRPQCPSVTSNPCNESN